MRSEIAFEACSIDEETDTVTELMLSIDREGVGCTCFNDAGECEAHQIITGTPNEMRAAYERMRTYFEQGIQVTGSVER